MVSACGGGGGGTSGGFNPSVFYENSVPDSTALNFTLNGNNAATSLAYNGVSAGFQTVNPNTYDISITENGQSESLWAVTDTLSSNSDYAVVALGQENFGSEYLKRAQLLVIPVDRTAPNGSKAQLYIVNGFEESAGVPTPAIDFTNPGQNPTFAATDIAPANSASLLVNSGSQDFIVRQNGSQGNYVEKTLTLNPGGVYLIVVSGINGATGPEAPEIEQISLPTR
jgi:hypothetical protein